MKEVISLFTDASFDDYICRAGYGVWCKYNGVSAKTNGITGYIADSNEAEAIGLLEGVKFIKSQEWYKPGMKITAATDSETVTRLLSGKANVSRVPCHLLAYQKQFHDLLGDDLSVTFKDIKAHINEADRTSRHHVNETVDKLAKDALKFVRIKEANMLSDIVSHSDYSIIVDSGIINKNLSKLSVFTLLMAERNMFLRLGFFGDKSSKIIQTLGVGPRLIAKARNTDANNLLEYHVSNSSKYKNSGRLNLVVNSKGQHLLQLASFYKVRLPSPSNRYESELYDVLAGVILGKAVDKPIPIGDRVLGNRSRAIILGLTKKESKISIKLIRAISTLCDALNVKLIMASDTRYHQVVGSYLVKNKAHKQKTSLIGQNFKIFDKHIKVTLPESTNYQDYRKLFERIQTIVDSDSLCIHEVKGNYVRSFSQNKTMTIMAGGYGANNIPRIMIYCSKLDFSRIMEQLKKLRQSAIEPNFKIRTEKGEVRIY